MHIALFDSNNFYGHTHKKKRIRNKHIQIFIWQLLKMQKKNIRVLRFAELALISPSKMVS